MTTEYEWCKTRDICKNTIRIPMEKPTESGWYTYIFGIMSDTYEMVDLNKPRIVVKAKSPLEAFGVLMVNGRSITEVALMSVEVILSNEFPPDAPFMDFRYV